MTNGDSKIEKRLDAGTNEAREAAKRVQRGLLGGNPTYQSKENHAEAAPTQAQNQDTQISFKRKEIYGKALNSPDGEKHFVSSQQAKTLRQDAKTSKTRLVEIIKFYKDLEEEWGEEFIKSSGVVDFKGASRRVYINAMIAEAHAKKYRSRGDPTKMVEQFEQDRKELEEMHAVLQEMSRDLVVMKEQRGSIHGEHLSQKDSIKTLVDEQRVMNDFYLIAFKDSTQQDIKNTCEEFERLKRRGSPTYYEFLQVKKTFRDFMRKNPEKLKSGLKVMEENAGTVFDNVTRHMHQYTDHTIVGVTRKGLYRTIIELDAQRTKAQRLLRRGALEEERDQMVRTFEELGLVTIELNEINEQLEGKGASRNERGVTSDSAARSHLQKPTTSLLAPQRPSPQQHQSLDALVEDDEIHPVL